LFVLFLSIEQAQIELIEKVFCIIMGSVPIFPFFAQMLVSDEVTKVKAERRKQKTNLTF